MARRRAHSADPREFDLLTSFGTRQQFRAYLDRDVVIDLGRVTNLVREPITNQDWERVQALLVELSTTYQTEVTLFDASGRILAASDLAQVGQSVNALPLPEEGVAVYLASLDGAIQMVQFLPQKGAESELIYLLSTEAVPYPAEQYAWVAGRPAEFEIATMPIAAVPMTDFTIPMTGPLGAEPTTMAALGLPATFVENTQASEQAFFLFVNRFFLAGIGASLLVAAALSWFTTRRILQPVDALMEATRQMRRGNLDHRVATNRQDELGQLGQAFNEMAGDLARQEQLRRNLVNDVAHELLTPLATIRGYLEAIQDGVIEPSPAVVGSVHAEALLLDHLIADLQELALAEAGQLPLNRRPIALPAVVDQAVAAVRPEANAKGLRISVNLAADLPTIAADPQRIGQVLRNLLRNAIQHTADGGEIEVTAVRQEGQIQISVRDNGAGIAPEHLPHLFDRFYRADPSRARTTGGTGLGLAIVKGVVEVHRGVVSAESALGEGTTFYFTLPANVVK